MTTVSIPVFESEFLCGVVEAFERRGKAIRYHGRLQYSRAVEDAGERLNVDFANLAAVRIRLSIWQDGIIWLGVTKPGARREGGWLLNLGFHSQAAGSSGPEICRRFEQTLAQPADAPDFWPPYESTV